MQTHNLRSISHIEVICMFTSVVSVPDVGDMSNELVRHFLIECTQKGVRLKGCPNEPYFGEEGTADK